VAFQPCLFIIALTAETKTYEARKALAKMTIDQALFKAVEEFKSGDVAAAKKLFRKIIEIEPNHSDANNNMGIILVASGDFEEAVPFIKTALESNFSVAQYWFNYIDVLFKLGRFTEALELLAVARDKGCKGQAFDELEEKLSSTAIKFEMQIERFLKLIDQGEIAKVLEEAEPLLREAPDSLSLLNVVSLANEKSGNFNATVDTSAQILNVIPNSPEAYSNMGSALKAQGKLEEAIVAYAKALEIQPNNAAALNNMGNALKEQGKLKEAVEAYTKALAIKPDFAEAYNNIGSALNEQGKLEKAIEAYNKALAIKPDFAEAYNNIGSALNEQGKLEKAIEAYNKALAIKPDYTGAYNNLGNALKEHGKLEAAIKSYKKALAIKPDYAEVYSNIGSAFNEHGKLEEAMEAYNKALAIKPDFAEAWSSGAAVLEEWNKLKELGLWLEKAFQILEPVPSDIRFIKAKLLWRNKDTKEAINLVSNIDVETIKPIWKAAYFQLKAKCFEASKDYDSAYVCFKNMNSIAIKSNNYSRVDPEGYFQNIRDQLEILNSNLPKNPTNHLIEQPDLVPVFLVGFPRSGTTLLDTILRSHSSIDVVEEQPLVSSAKAFVAKNGYTEIGQVLPQKIIVGAKQAYITELDKHRKPTDNKSTLIDKLPLNLVNIPFIQQLYPRAKFILALRHPLDTILSCWMQDFKLNSAMANMVELNRIVEFYCVAMETFKICRTQYNLSVHEIRYEDLLENLSGETSTLLKFLELDWEAKMENYHETALTRGRINTPSYSQVVQPIYKHAKYRWLNYEKHLKQYIKQVEPWINEFGYSDH
jgi:tetratricopeptide (TPR) repeat protein